MERTGVIAWDRAGLGDSGLLRRAKGIWHHRKEPKRKLILQDIWHCWLGYNQKEPGSSCLWGERRRNMWTAQKSRKQEGWESLEHGSCWGAAGTCSVLCRVHVVAPGSRVTAWKCHWESTSCAFCFLSWQFQGLGWCLPGTVSVLARLSPAPGVMCASAMLLVNSWGHSWSVVWDWGLFALKIWGFWKSTQEVKESSFIFSKSKIKSCWRKVAGSFLLCGKPCHRRPEEVQKWSLECLLRRLFQVLVMLTQNLLQ